MQSIGAISHTKAATAVESLSTKSNDSAATEISTFKSISSDHSLKTEKVADSNLTMDNRIQNITTQQSPITNNASTIKPNITSFKGFEATTERLLAPDAQGNVNEEQMQNALAYFMLTDKDKALGSSYLEAFNKQICSGTIPPSPEDAVKAALKELVSQEKLSKEDAERINGISFQAAQLDSNLTALYDSKGGNNDPTIAVMNLDEALAKAKGSLQLLESGALQGSIRSLDAPSNTVAQSSTSRASSAGGFLWKPVSESDRNLVVLVPSSLSGKIQSAEIHSSLPADDSTLIESGRYVGNLNRGRPTFRFKKPGASYPNNCYVVAHLTNGQIETYKIENPSNRVE